MREFQLVYRKHRGLIAWLKQIREYCKANAIPGSSMVFRFCSESVDADTFTPIVSVMRGFFPEALCLGTTSYGGILHGSIIRTQVTVSCTVFEDPKSRALLLRLPMSYETQKESAETLLRAVEENAWVKAVEILTTTYGVDLPQFCRDISSLPEEIAVYGGGAHSPEVSEGIHQQTYVFSGEGKPARQSAVVLLMGGPRLHVRTDTLTGWRSIGKAFSFTTSDGNLLTHIENRPALEVYQRYLGIPADENFFRLANVFPLFFEAEGVQVLRVVSGFRPDGALALAASVSLAENVRFAYGDPLHIIDEVMDRAEAYRQFAPQSLRIYSCAARRLFWGDDEVSRETLPFEHLAPASGLFTSAEILRVKKTVLVHNCTLVTAGLREGEQPEVLPESPSRNEAIISRQLLISSCLASFIAAQEEDRLSRQDGGGEL